MARLDVEYTEKAFHEPTQLANWIESNIFDMTIDYGYTNIDEFLKQALSKKELQMPQKTREVFIYIPQSMLRIMGTVFTFSRRDVMTGKDWGGMFIVDQTQIIEKMASLRSAISLSARTTRNFGAKAVKSSTT